MDVSDHDRSVLRRQAEKQAEIASLPIQKQNAKDWSRLNTLQPGRPLIWINEIPWNEMNVNDELTPQTEDPALQGMEMAMRRTLYKWEHMPGDMVVDDYIASPIAVRDTGFGIGEQVDIRRTDDTSNIVSREFTSQIDGMEDLEKIKTPEVTVDWEQTERNYELRCELFEDILPVRKTGVGHQWFAPWDFLVRWWDPEKALMDLAMRPDLVHAAMDRLVNGYISKLDQHVELGVLDLNNCNCRIGSGGLGFCDELPQDDFDPENVRPMDQWGCAAAQIFSEVSPKMHEEFALSYERRWLGRFGLTYYGCCEPLHLKVDLLSSIPNLRKISMSPWVDPEIGAEKIGQDFVYSHKPNPAIFADDLYNPEKGRRELIDVLEKTRGCVVEIIMKDISTVEYEPQRLWQWETMAREMAAEYA
ncbi:MAG: hypothetical protein ACLFWL_10230 [Candidatus Brocadiia bacterium]